MDAGQETSLEEMLRFYRMDFKNNAGRMFYQQIFKSKVIISRTDCKLDGQHFFIKHRSHHELIEFVAAMHEISRCSCGTDWPMFQVYAYKPGENLIIKE